MNEQCFGVNIIILRTDMDKKNTEWVEPTIKNLGDAKDLIKGLNPVFDSKNSLVPSDEFNTTTS